MVAVDPRAYDMHRLILEIGRLADAVETCATYLSDIAGHLDDGVTLAECMLPKEQT